eukprot:Ihof_evm1s336 gene=Ihof_evmTU1s336
MAGVSGDNDVDSNQYESRDLLMSSETRNRTRMLENNHEDRSRIDDGTHTQSIGVPAAFTANSTGAHICTESIQDNNIQPINSSTSRPGTEKPRKTPKPPKHYLFADWFGDNNEENGSHHQGALNAYSEKGGGKREGMTLRQRVTMGRDLKYAPPIRNLPFMRNRQGQKLKTVDPYTARKLAQEPVFRPWFNYISLLAMAACLAMEIGFNRGIEKIGVGVSTTSVNIKVFGLSAPQEITYQKAENMWIGPDTFTIIELGAKYSPCMRVDEKIINAIKKQNQEYDSIAWGCCTLVDNTCAMTQQTECSNRNIARMNIEVKEWVANTTCASLQCDVVNRPCCLGLQGQCVHIGQQHCEVLKGNWRKDGELCQTTSTCLNDVCKMGGISNPDRPNQWWRFITPIFLHVGIFHFILNALFQLSIGIQHPWLELMKLTIVIFIALFIGTLPWVDNFAHLGGFAFGIFAALVFLPLISFGKWDKRRKIFLISAGSAVLLAMMI